MPEDPLIVIIATSGNITGLSRTLTSLSQCVFPANLDRIIVVENGPKRNAEHIVTGFSDELPFEYCHTPLANKSNALNHAIKRLRDSDFVFFSDDDVDFDQQILSLYAEAASGKNGGIVLGGSLEVEKLVSMSAELSNYAPNSLVGFTPQDPTKQNFLGANWGAFVSDIRRAGGFDPRFGPGSPLNATGQEEEMMRQLRQIGAQFIALPKAVVSHRVDTSSLSVDFVLQRQYRVGIQNGIRAGGYTAKTLKLLSARACYHLLKSVALIPILRLSWLPWPYGMSLRLATLQRFSSGFLFGYWNSKIAAPAIPADEPGQETK